LKIKAPLYNLYSCFLLKTLSFVKTAKVIKILLCRRRALSLYRAAMSGEYWFERGIYAYMIFYL